MRINQSINPMFSCFCVVFGLGRADRFGERERDLCSYVFFFLYRGVVENGCIMWRDMFLVWEAGVVLCPSKYPCAWGGIVHVKI
jgi:hypothetical protein